MASCSVCIVNEGIDESSWRADLSAFLLHPKKRRLRIAIDDPTSSSAFTWQAISHAQNLTHLELIINEPTTANSDFRHFPPSHIKFPHLIALNYMIASLPVCNCVNTVGKGKKSSMMKEMRKIKSIDAAPGESFPRLKTFGYTGNNTDMHVLERQVNHKHSILSTVEEAVLEINGVYGASLFKQAATMFPNVKCLKLGSAVPFIKNLGWRIAMGECAKEVDYIVSQFSFQAVL